MGCGKASAKHKLLEQAVVKQSAEIKQLQETNQYLLKAVNGLASEQATSRSGNHVDFEDQIQKLESRLTELGGMISVKHGSNTLSRADFEGEHMYISYPIPEEGSEIRTSPDRGDDDRNKVSILEDPKIQEMLEKKRQVFMKKPQMPKQELDQESVPSMHTGEFSSRV